MEEQPAITICFDDGRKSGLQGAKILENYHMIGTFYPVTSLIGLPDVNGPFMDWHDLQGLAERGHEIGNHTHTHGDSFPTWERNCLVTDIITANQELIAHGITPTTFAYPFGKYCDPFRNVIPELGFRAARTIDFGYNTFIDAYLLQCLMVEKKTYLR